MRFSPVLILHICSGTIGLFSGAAAMVFRKGSARHGAAGNVFVVSMLSLAASGTYLAVAKSEPGNILGGVLTFYLVATAWMTARRGNAKTGRFDWGALLFILTAGAFTIACGLEAATSPTGLIYGLSRRALLFPWLRDAGCGRGGHSHARGRRRLRQAANHAASLADVLWLIHRLGVHIPGAPGDIPGFVTQNRRARSPRHPASDLNGFLASSCSFQKVVCSAQLPG
jgi:uncharacterized membrane protein